MPQWNTSSVRDAFSQNPLTADLCTTYLRQPPEKQSPVLNEQSRIRILRCMSFNLTILESAQVFKIRVLRTLCKFLLCNFVYVYFLVNLLQTLKIQSDGRESEKNYTFLFNPLKSDAHINNMRVPTSQRTRSISIIKINSFRAVYENMQFIMSFLRIKYVLTIRRISSCTGYGIHSYRW